MSRTWSSQQEAIFEWFRAGQGSLVVRARAGCGKTSTILEGIKYAPESKILFAAFNKRIAKELQEKCGLPNVEVKTLHALGFAFVRKAYKSVKVDDQIEMQRASQVAGLDADRGDVAAIANLVSKAKNTSPFATQDDLLDLVGQFDITASTLDDDQLAHAARAAMDLAINCKDEAISISFDDMVWLPVVKKLVRPWYSMVVIDECQDMNLSQLLLAQAACKKAGRKVAIGDDRQAIYAFRGADSNSLDRLKTEWKAIEMGLTTTYRCAKSIVQRATQLVPDYQAAPTAPEGIVDNASRSAMMKQAAPGDFVLSRKNAPLMVACLQLLRAGVPARVEGRDVGQQLANTVRKLKARSVPDFIGRVESWKVKETQRLAKRRGADAQLQVVEDQYETFLALADGAANVEEILARCVNLFADSVNPDGTLNRRPAVVLSSVHKAKGLETQRAWLLSETFRNSTVEEQNIYYVAVTRAISHLTFVVEDGNK